MSEDRRPGFVSKQFVRFQRGALVTSLVVGAATAISLVKLAFAGHFLGSDFGLVLVGFLVLFSGYVFAFVGEKTGFWKGVDRHTRRTLMSNQLSDYDRAVAEYNARMIARAVAAELERMKRQNGEGL